MSNVQLVQVETLRSLAFGSISGTYAALGTALAYPARLICITNSTNGNLLLSLDGTNNHFFLAAGSFKLFDLNANRMYPNPLWVLAKGTQFFVKQSTAPSSGEVYLESLYGVNS